VSRIAIIRRSYEPGDWWRVPLLVLALLIARLVRVAIPNTVDEEEAADA